MSYTPLLNNWGLYFKKADGEENRQTVMAALAKFWSNQDENKLEIPGKCIMGGEISSDLDPERNTRIFTSYITSFERVESVVMAGLPREIFCATSTSGEKYYFYSDNHNGYTFLLLVHMIRNKELRTYPGYYLEATYRDTDFL